MSEHPNYRCGAWCPYPEPCTYGGVTLQAPPLSVERACEELHAWLITLALEKGQPYRREDGFGLIYDGRLLYDELDGRIFEFHVLPVGELERLRKAAERVRSILPLDEATIEKIAADGAAYVKGMLRAKYMTSAVAREFAAAIRAAIKGNE